MSDEAVMVMLQDILARLTRMEAEVAVLRVEAAGSRRVDPEVSRKRSEAGRIGGIRSAETRSKTKQLLEANQVQNEAIASKEVKQNEAKSSNCLGALSRDKDLPLSDSSALVLDASKPLKENPPSGVKRKAPSDPYCEQLVPAVLAETPGFHDAWLAWVEMRKGKGAAITPRAAGIALRKLAEQPTRAVAYLETAAVARWLGVEYAWLDNRNRAVNGTRPREGPTAERDRARDLKVVCSTPEEIAEYERQVDAWRPPRRTAR